MLFCEVIGRRKEKKSQTFPGIERKIGGLFPGSEKKKKKKKKKEKEKRKRKKKKKKEKEKRKRKKKKKRIITIRRFPGMKFN